MNCIFITSGFSLPSVKRTEHSRVCLLSVERPGSITIGAFSEKVPSASRFML
jgi:hypothetical protein